jgi:hypothetical protein
MLIYYKVSKRGTTACTRNSLGSDSNAPSNVIFSSSSIYSDTRSAAKAQLLGSSSWRPHDDDITPWLRIDLGGIQFVCALATQGDPHSEERTKKFKIKWSMANMKWKESKVGSACHRIGCVL